MNAKVTLIPFRSTSQYPLIPTKYCIVPVGHVCTSSPASNLHPSTRPFPPSACLIKSIISPFRLVLRQLIKPSNTITKGTTGITYVQNRCSHCPQNQYQLPNHKNGANVLTVNKFPKSRPCNSKIANPSLVSSVFFSIFKAKGSGKW